MKTIDKRNTVTITTYKTDMPGFMVDIVKTEGRTEDTFEAWIYHKDHLAKLLMFKCSDLKEEDFMQMVECFAEKNAEYYREEVMDA